MKKNSVTAFKSIEFDEFMHYIYGYVLKNDLKLF